MLYQIALVCVVRWGCCHSLWISLGETAQILLMRSLYQNCYELTASLNNHSQTGNPISQKWIIIHYCMPCNSGYNTILNQTSTYIVLHGMEWITIHFLQKHFVTRWHHSSSRNILLFLLWAIENIWRLENKLLTQTIIDQLNWQLYTQQRQSNRYGRLSLVIRSVPTWPALNSTNTKIQ